MLALLRSEATAIDLPTPPRGGADQSSGLDENEKSHQSAFKFPLIPSGSDGSSINSQGFQRSLIRMPSNIYSAFRRFAGPTSYCSGA